MRLRRTRDLKNYVIAAVNADIGKLDGFYFDDRWTIRYIVVKTRPVLSARMVLISTVALRKPAWRPLRLRVRLTWEQVEKSPRVNLNRPVLRRHEIEHHNYYGWPYYWSKPGPRPHQMKTRSPLGAGSRRLSPNQSCLHGTHELIGCQLVAVGGPVGHVQDILFDDRSWEIRYLVIGTGSWLTGKKILLRPLGGERINWQTRKVYVAMTKKTVRGSPRWDPSRPVNRKYELYLHHYYGWAPYWTHEK